jgi:drug/metabolite transporter (DMT)-like permease
MRLMRVLGLGLGFSGVVLLVWGRLSFKDGGDGLAILAGLAVALSYSLAAVYTRRRLQGVASLKVATGSQISGALIMLPLTLWAWPTTPPSPAAWGSVLLLAVACTAMAYVLYFRLIERLGAQGAVTVTYLVPVFAMLWGDLFLQAHPTLQMLLGVPRYWWVWVWQPAGSARRVARPPARALWAIKSARSAACAAACSATTVRAAHRP